MSDYGTSIIVRRRDGVSVDDGDRAALERVLAPLRVEERHLDYQENPMQFRVLVSLDARGRRGFVVLLSEYWHDFEEGAEPPDPDGVLEADEGVARQVIDVIRPALESDYELELIADHW